MNPLGHALFRKRRVENVFRLHVGQQLVEFGRGPVLGRVGIPDLDDIMGLFRANGQAIHHIGRVRHDGAEHGGHGIRDKGLAGVPF